MSIVGDIPELPWKSMMAIGETTWIVGLVVFILLERRTPVATLAWIFGLVLLPGLGIPVYLFLGPRRLRRKKLRYKDKRLAVTRALADVTARMPAGDATRLATIGEKLQHTPVSTARKLVVHHEGDALYDRVLEAIDTAKDHVHVEYYIYEPDTQGVRLRDALVRARGRGVEVRLLVDAVGSPSARAGFFEPLVAAGGHFRRFLPPRLGIVWTRFFNFRTHRKIVVVDGVVGFTGGMNWASCHSHRDSGDAAWRDTQVELHGPVVADLQRTFLENWVYSDGDSPTTARYFPEQEPGDELVQILRSGPDRDIFPIHAFFVSAITMARERVLLTTPYLVPDPTTLYALKTTALRGVKVEILVPVRGDSRLVSAAARSYFEELIEAGCHVHTYDPCMLHAKLLVVDDELATIGTANFDNRSFRLNFEVMAVLYGKAHASALAEQFERDLARATRVGRRQLHAESIAARLFESAARLFSPLM